MTVGSAVATIYGVDVAEIRLPLPDDQLAYLDLPLSYRGARNNPGPAVTVRTAFAGATYSWKGQIVRTESEIDPVSRMVHVVAEVRDPYAEGGDLGRPPLAVGMYVEAEIEGRRFEQLAVLPRVAVRGQNQVLVIDDNDRVRFRDVEILRSTVESIFVSSGLDQGERVVVSSIDIPTDGMLVRVTGGAEDRLVEGTEADTLLQPDQTIPNPVDQDVTTAIAAQPAWLQEVLEEESVRTEVGTSPPVDAVTPLPEIVTERSRPVRTNAVTVLPFTNVGEHATDVEVARVVTQQLTERLKSMPVVTVVPSLDGANWVVGGSVQRLGNTVRVMVRLVDANEGVVVHSSEIDGSSENLTRLQTEVAAAMDQGLREVLGDSIDLVRSDGLGMNVVAVRTFSNVTGLEQDNTLAMGLGLVVATHLDSLDTFTVVDSEDEATWVVTGGVQRVGEVVRITARLVDRLEGTVVKAVKLDGPIAELTRLQTEVAAAMDQGLREVLGDSIDAL